MVFGKTLEEAHPFCHMCGRDFRRLHCCICNTKGVAIHRHDAVWIAPRVTWKEGNHNVATRTVAATEEGKPYCSECVAIVDKVQLVIEKELAPRKPEGPGWLGLFLPDAREPKLIHEEYLTTDGKEEDNQGEGTGG